MKKEKVTYPVIRKIKPLFWKECRFCGDSFRREEGYEILESTKNTAHLFYSYCCNECADSVEKVKKLVSPLSVTSHSVITWDDKEKARKIDAIHIDTNKKVIDRRFDQVTCRTCLHFPKLENSIKYSATGFIAPNPCRVCFPHSPDMLCDRIKRCKYEENIL